MLTQGNIVSQLERELLFVEYRSSNCAFGVFHGSWSTTPGSSSLTILRGFLILLDPILKTKKERLNNFLQINLNFHSTISLFL